MRGPRGIGGTQVYWGRLCFRDGTDLGSNPSCATTGMWQVEGTPGMAQLPVQPLPQPAAREEALIAPLASGCLSKQSPRTA